MPENWPELISCSFSVWDDERLAVWHSRVGVAVRGGHHLADRQVERLREVVVALVVRRHAP